MKRTDKVMNTIRKTDLRMPCSWNECSTEQLELISRIMLLLNIGLSVWVVTNDYRN